MGPAAASVECVGHASIGRHHLGCVNPAARGLESGGCGFARARNRCITQFGQRRIRVRGPWIRIRVRHHSLRWNQEPGQHGEHDVSVRYLEC